MPDANKKKFAIRREYLENSYTEFSRANIVLQDGPQKMISINYFDRLQNHGSNATIYEFSDSTRISPIKRIDAKFISFDTLSNNWFMEDVIERNFSNDSEIVTRSVKLNIGSLHITPIEIIKKKRSPTKWDILICKNLSIGKKEVDTMLRDGKLNFIQKFHFRLQVLLLFFWRPICLRKTTKWLGNSIWDFAFNLLHLFGVYKS